MFTHLTDLLSNKKKDEPTPSLSEAESRSTLPDHGTEDREHSPLAAHHLPGLDIDPEDSMNNHAIESSHTESNKGSQGQNLNTHLADSSQAHTTVSSVICGDEDEILEGDRHGSLVFPSNGRIYLKPVPRLDGDARGSDAGSEHFEIIDCEQLTGYTKAADRSNNPGHLETLKNLGINSFNKVKNMNTEAVSEQLGKFTFAGTTNKSIQFAEPPEKPTLAEEDFDEVSVDNSGDEHEFHAVSASSSIYSDDDDTIPEGGTARTSLISDVDDHCQTSKFAHHRDTLARLPRGFKIHNGKVDRDGSLDSTYSTEKSPASAKAAIPETKNDIKEKGDNTETGTKAAETPQVSAYGIANDFVQHVSWHLRPFSSATYQVIFEGYLGNEIMKIAEQNLTFWNIAMANDSFIDAARIVADVVKNSSLHQRVSANAVGARAYCLAGPVEAQYISLIEKAVSQAVPYI